jgi:hypothetical protein
LGQFNLQTEAIARVAVHERAAATKGMLVVP